MPELPEHDVVQVSMQDYVEALIEPVAQRMRAGDVTLREHIERVLREYGEQIKRELHLADVLEQSRLAVLDRKVDERWDRVEEQIEQLRRERGLVTGAQAEAIRKAEEATNLAIAKAEAATEKRFESVNEFRAQQQDIINRFMPREVAEAQFDSLRHMITELTEKLSKIA